MVVFEMWETDCVETGKIKVTSNDLSYYNSINNNKNKNII